MTHSRGFTLVELMIGVAMLAIAITALLGAFLGQGVLAEHARNLTWAINDANRVMEQLRLQNMNPNCTTVPSAAVPPASGVGTCTAPILSWDDWLQRCGGGKSIQPNPASQELIVITCRNQANTTFCTGTEDPMRITVAVCWRHRNRTLGECTWNGAALLPNPGAGQDLNVTESPAMLSTLMTCRR